MLSFDLFQLQAHGHEGGSGASSPFPTVTASPQGTARSIPGPLDPRQISSPDRAGADCRVEPWKDSFVKGTPEH